MGQKKDLLIEIGTEELPPKSLKNLAVSFCQEMSKALKKNELNFKNINWYATPRRLSLLISDLDTALQKILSNDLFINTLKSSYAVAAMVSEEHDTIIEVETERAGKVKLPIINFITLFCGL